MPQLSQPIYVHTFPIIGYNYRSIRPVKIRRNADKYTGRHRIIGIGDQLLDSLCGTRIKST